MQVLEEQRESEESKPRPARVCTRLVEETETHVLVRLLLLCTGC